MLKTRVYAAAAIALGLAAAACSARADDLTDNAKAQAVAAGKAYENALLRMRAGLANQSAETIETLYLWSRRWMEAEQETNDKKEDRAAAAQAHLERMKKLEDLVKKLHDVGALAGADPAAAEFYRLEAERLVLLAKAAK
jgi:hypothetical protein